MIYAARCPRNTPIRNPACRTRSSMFLIAADGEADRVGTSQAAAMRALPQGREHLATLRRQYGEGVH